MTLFSDELDWHGEAGTPVHGFVLNDGLLVASAYRTISDSTGRAALRFSRSSGYQGPPRAGHLLPTDKVVLIAAGHMPMTVTLPAVSADFDAMRDRVGGEAPPNSAAHLTLRDASSGATRMDSEVTVGTSGRFSVDAGPGVDLLHSDLGEIVFTDTGGNHIRSRIVAPTVDVVVGWPVKCFRQRGEAHNVEIRDAVGNVVESGCTGPRARPVEVGDLVTLYLGPDFMVPGAPPTVSLRVPSLSLRRDPSSQSLLGGGPPNQRLVVTVGSSFRAEDRQVVQTNERGQFTVTAPDDPGTSVTIHMDGLNGITVEKRVNLVSVFVGLNNMGVAARAGSIGEDLPIDLTLIDPQGDIKADVSLSGQVLSLIHI